MECRAKVEEDLRKARAKSQHLWKPANYISESALTGNDVPRVNRIVILDESKAIHELDLTDSARAILEVGLNFVLSDCRPEKEKRVISTVSPSFIEKEQSREEDPSSR